MLEKAPKFSQQSGTALLALDLEFTGRLVLFNFRHCFAPDIRI